MDSALIIKKTITLLALVDPLMAIPIFLSATKDVASDVKRRFALTLGITVTVALVAAGLVGQHLLALLGVSLGAMQVAGGAIAFLVAIAMVLAKEEAVKISPAENMQAAAGPAIVPLGIPLLVGPASLSFVMATSAVSATHLSVAEHFAHQLIPAAVAGLATWLTFGVASRAGPWISPTSANVVERLSGFLLAAISIEMIAAGLRALFPAIAP